MVPLTTHTVKISISPPVSVDIEKLPVLSSGGEISYNRCSNFATKINICHSKNGVFGASVMSYTRSVPDTISGLGN